MAIAFAVSGWAIAAVLAGCVVALDRKTRRLERMLEQWHADYRIRRLGSGR